MPGPFFATTGDAAGVNLSSESIRLVRGVAPLIDLTTLLKIWHRDCVG